MKLNGFADQNEFVQASNGKKHKLMSVVAETLAYVKVCSIKAMDFPRILQLRVLCVLETARGNERDQQSRARRVHPRAGLLGAHSPCHLERCSEGVYEAGSVQRWHYKLSCFQEVAPGT